jgi:SpoVK/Ycf46/Vps4 family AAA+-type ATPase
LEAAAIYFDRAETLLGESDRLAHARRVLLGALTGHDGIVFLGSEQAWDETIGQPAGFFFKAHFPVPTCPLRRQIWQGLLAPEPVAREVDAVALADKFNLTAGQIHRAIAEARQTALLREPAEREMTMADLLHACRSQSTARLTTLARKITPLYTWSDITLPADKLAQLREACAHVKHRQQVFGEWGFERKVSLGKGLGILFAGASGTGKTMAAEIIAAELGLDLYKIDLSCVISKYIGETEKNLSRIFAEAETANAILFFDEADAVFGKRSEVKDSHDRYANIEINYLLQRIEEYEGTVILASNFQKNIDEAFLRRMRFVIEFPLPEEAERRRIWQNIFPSDTPLATDIDFDFLARKFQFAGGAIRNVALSAAFIAAQNGGLVDMEKIIRATRREFQKTGKLCVKSDFESYFDLICGKEAAV